MTGWKERKGKEEREDDESGKEKKNYDRLDTGRKQQGKESGKGGKIIANGRKVERGRREKR